MTLTSGNREAVLQDAPTSQGRCLLGVYPRDELAVLCVQLDELLAGRRKSVHFEPQEPNFCLDVEAAPGGWVVTSWIDAGNQTSDHYTWDAMGARFFTSTDRVRAFRSDLAAIKAT